MAAGSRKKKRVREADGGGGAGRAGAPAPAAADTSLEYSQNVVTSGAGDDPERLRRFEVSKCGCDCWFCPDCCTRKGYNLRAELVPILEKFRGLMMITLTIDPELFESPREAYLYVREQRGISRLMRDLNRAGALHSRRYLYVLEFQKRTEQVHFHLLVDASFIPKAAIDASWSKLRPENVGPASDGRPEFGTTWISKSDFEGGAEHAARYATKYLVKTPGHGWPSWVLAMGCEHRVHRYQTSRGFWGRIRKPSVPTGEKRESKPRSYAERIADCGKYCNVFEFVEGIDFRSGEALERRNWVSRLFLDSEALRAIADCGEKGRPRLSVKAATVRACIERLRHACGRDVSVISGVGGD